MQNYRLSFFQCLVQLSVKICTYKACSSVKGCYPLVFIFPVSEIPLILLINSLPCLFCKRLQHSPCVPINGIPERVHKPWISQLRFRRDSSKHLADNLFCRLPRKVACPYRTVPCVVQSCLDSVQIAVIGESVSHRLEHCGSLNLL